MAIPKVGDGAGQGGLRGVSQSGRVDVEAGGSARLILNAGQKIHRRALSRHHHVHADLGLESKLALKFVVENQERSGRLERRGRSPKAQKTYVAVLNHLGLNKKAIPTVVGIDELGDARSRISELFWRRGRGRRWGRRKHPNPGDVKTDDPDPREERNRCQPPAEHPFRLRAGGWPCGLAAIAHRGGDRRWRATAIGPPRRGFGPRPPSRDGGHGGGSIRRVRLQHLFEQRTQTPVDRSQIRYGAPLFQYFELGTAHVDRSSGQAFRQHQTETVDVRLRRDVAPEQAELLRRNIIVFAGESAADDGALARTGRSRDAEIDDLGFSQIAAGDEYIVRRSEEHT